MYRSYGEGTLSFGYIGHFSPPVDIAPPLPANFLALIANLTVILHNAGMPGMQFFPLLNLSEHHGRHESQDFSPRH